MKSRNAVLNMTEGRPMGLLIRFSIPMLIGNIFQQLYNLADSIIVGRLVSANALAAIGASASVTFLFFALCNGVLFKIITLRRKSTPISGFRRKYPSANFPACPTR